MGLLTRWLRRHDADERELRLRSLRRRFEAVSPAHGHSTKHRRPRRWGRLAAVALVAAGLIAGVSPWLPFPPTIAAAEQIIGPARIIDGDTLEVRERASAFTASTLLSFSSNADERMPRPLRRTPAARKPRRRWCASSGAARSSARRMGVTATGAPSQPASRRTRTLLARWFGKDGPSPTPASVSPTSSTRSPPEPPNAPCGLGSSMLQRSGGGGTKSD